MNNQELKRRSIIYGSVQLIALFLGVVGIVLWAYGQIIKADILIIIAYLVININGVAHNWFYFRSLDFPDLGEWKKYIGPSIILLILIASTLAYQFFFQGYGIDPKSQRNLAILISTFATFFTGFIGFSLPLVLHRNELETTDQTKTYGQIIYDVDKTIDALRESVFSPERQQTSQKQKIDDVTVTVQKIADSVQLMVGIYYRTHIENKRRPVDFFKFASLVIGPLISALTSALVK